MMERGRKLGPYEILSAAGAGGMGEVYEARDTRLDRTVAVKVLPPHLTRDASARARFEREARAISQLSHPHICTLYDVHLRQGSGGQVGLDEDIDYIVMEYIEGETLADGLAKAAVPLERALEYGIQIADALDTAHRNGVVHRDLKPGNIMITTAGVKLLDFGLARVTTPPAGASVDSENQTAQKPLTDAGALLGTVQYMAPEQLEGRTPRYRALSIGSCRAVSSKTLNAGARVSATWAWRMQGRTSSRSARCFTKWSQEKKRLPARARRV